VPFLVSDNLVCPAILGADFLDKTDLLMDLRIRAFHFMFDPSNQLRLCSNRDHVPVDTSFNTAQFLEEVDENSVPGLNRLCEGEVSVISYILRDFPQVFTRNLGLTTLLVYDIQLTDTIPVSSSPYRFRRLRLIFCAGRYKSFWITASADIPFLHIPVLYF
jgi:hypothetical protein